jgi:type IV pilus assembly protein PilM
MTMFERWRIHCWPVAVDLGSDGLRMLQLSPTDGPPRVHAGAQWHASELEDRPSRVLAGALQAGREILQGGHFHGDRAVGTLDTGELQIRTLRLEEMSDEEMHCHIQARAGELFEEDLAFTQLIVLRGGTVYRGDQTCQEAILLAVPNHALRDRADALRAMGLQPVGMDIEPLSLFRAFGRLRRRASDRGVVSAIIKISRDSTVVVVGQGRRIMFIKRIDQGENQLSRAAADNLGLTVPDARRIRRELICECCERSRVVRGTFDPNDLAGDDPLVWTLHDAVREQADSLINEIGLCLRYCSTTYGCPAIEEVILSGVGAWDPSLVLLLKDRLGVTGRCAWPMQPVDASHCRFFNDRRLALSDWTTCMGLAQWGEAGCRDNPEFETLLDEPVRLTLQGVPR